MLNYTNIAIIADKSPLAREALGNIERQYDIKSINYDYEDYESLDALIVLGGDGFMLHVIHKLLEYHDNLKPIYGMNCGTVGFLLNDFEVDNLYNRLKCSTITTIRPLKMRATTKSGEVVEQLAINEISMLRSTSQAAQISISIDGRVQLEQLICDGVLVSSPAGSSAYNFSVGGPIIPLNADLVALTPISPFRPKRWHGALLPHHTKLEFSINNPDKRSVNAVADFIEVADVTHVEVESYNKRKIQLLFDNGHSLEERIIREQFRV